MKNRQQGFIQITLLIAILAGVIFIGGVGYLGFIKYKTNLAYQKEQESEKVQYKQLQELQQKYLSKTDETLPKPNASEDKVKSALESLPKPTAVFNYHKIIFELDGQVILKQLNPDKTTILISRKDLEVADPTLNSIQDFHPADFSLSNDNDLIIFNVKKDAFTYHPKTYIFDLMTQKIKYVIDNEDPQYFWSKELSNDNKYLQLYGSTCPCGGELEIVNLETNKAIYNASVGFRGWSPAGYENTLFITSQEYSFNIPAEAWSDSIKLLNIKTDIVSERILLRGSDQISYSHPYWISDRELGYEMINYSKPFPKEIPSEKWEEYMEIYNKPKITYWKINIDTLKQESIPEPIKQEIEYVKSKIWPYRSFPLSPDKKWELITYGSDLDFNSDIYIVDASETVGLEIAHGNDAIWLPDFNRSSLIETSFFWKVDFKTFIREQDPEIKLCREDGVQPPVDIDSIEYSDLTNDGIPEAIVRASSCLSGTAGPDINNVYKLSISGDPINIKINRVPGEIYDQVWAGYEGHFSYNSENGKLIANFPIYKDGDSNCCPQGGWRKIYYKWDGSGFIFDRFEDVVER
ncbi:MAG TPA: type II secretion system protein [Candidatus Paceibacterota bacterium]